MPLIGGRQRQTHRMEEWRPAWSSAATASSAWASTSCMKQGGLLPYKFPRAQGAAQPPDSGRLASRSMEITLLLFSAPPVGTGHGSHRNHTSGAQISMQAEMPQGGHARRAGCGPFLGEGVPPGLREGVPAGLGRAHGD